MEGRSSVFFRWYLLWMAACAMAGWGLSWLKQLTVAGYILVLPPLLAGLIYFFKEDSKAGRVISLHELWLRIKKRFSRPLPLFFLAVACLIIIGGVWHAPSNYDALNYRLPRMLNWLADRGWTWIPTGNERLNYSGVGWEWAALPLFILHSDRLLFLINALGFMLLPGLFFSVAAQAGIRRKTAWVWMWIFPLGYGFLTQAGSIGNDALGAIFCLMAIHYGLRARTSRKAKDVWLAGLAAAVMTSVKISNLPLLLPCLIAVGPALKFLRQRPWGTLLALIIGVSISAVPITLFNLHYSGDWAGDPQNQSRIKATRPSVAMLGNGMLVAEQALMPPLLPGARKIETQIYQRLPASWRQELDAHFPRFNLSHLNELPQEEGAGLGLGVTFLLGLAIVMTFSPNGRQRNLFLTSPRPCLIFLLAATAWLAAGVYCAKMASEAAARLMLPYYFLMLLPLLALRGQDWLVRQRHRAWLAVFVAAMILPALILSPARPLFPALTFTRWLAENNPSSAVPGRTLAVYVSYAKRNDLLAPLSSQLPEDVKNVGWLAGPNDANYSLWRPFGHRKIIELGYGKGPLTVPENIQWIVINQNHWQEISRVPLKKWADEHGAEITATMPITSLISRGPENWCLLHIGGRPVWAQ